MASLLRARVASGLLLLTFAGAPLSCDGGASPDDDAAASGGSEAGSGGRTSSGAGTGTGTGGTDGATGGRAAAGGAIGSGGAKSTGGSSAAAGMGGIEGEGGSAGEGTVPGTGPCYDEECLGVCEGSCETGFVCNTEPVICTQAFTTWCGCDGESFQSPTGCANQAYAHRGACEPREGAGKNCDERDIVCLPIVAPEPCPEGQVYSVEGGCYGGCVPVGECGCTSHEECPDPEDKDQYACHQNTQRCGDWL